MKLRNKKTGEIGYLIVGRGSSHYVVANNEWNSCGKYSSLAEFNEEWEDMPEEPKEYWYIDWTPEIGVYHTRDVDSDADKRQKQIGNYFETKEEAEKAVEKLKAFKRLKDKGFRFAGWDMRNGDGGYEPSIGFELNGVTDVLEKDEIAQEIAQDIDICFGGEDA